jgi:hypothetical protein
VLQIAVLPLANIVLSRSYLPILCVQNELIYLLNHFLLHVTCVFSSHASVRRNFADDIKGVLSGFNSSLNADGSAAAEEAPLVAPVAKGSVWRDEKVRSTEEYMCFRFGGNVYHMHS